ncbi:MAG: hypothetical protein V1798_09330, partial [Pseudomonadota bacterium]
PGPAREEDIPSDILSVERDQIVPALLARRGVAEARVLGDDLNKMEFVPSLTRVTGSQDGGILH